MNTSWRSVRLRATALAVVTTAALSGLIVGVGPSIDLDTGQPFGALLSQWCTVVLLGCAAWAWLVTCLVLLEAVRAAESGPLRTRRRGMPAAYRRWVLGVCGLALTAGAAAPALATPGPVHLDPQPAASTPYVSDRLPTPARPASAVGGEIVVHPGDSLWRLTAERLAPDADDATIEHAWHRLYAANADVIGPDPDHIEPGQRLQRPQGW